MGIQRHPAVPGRVLHAALVQQAQDRVGLTLRGGLEDAGGDVLEQGPDGLDRIGFGGADQTHRTALDPAVGVGAGDDGAVGLGDPTGLVEDDAARGVVRDPGQLGAVVADGTVDGVQLVVDVLAGALDAAVPGQAGAFEAHAGDLPVLPEDLHGAVPEVQVQSAGDGPPCKSVGSAPSALPGCCRPSHLPTGCPTWAVARAGPTAP